MNTAKKGFYQVLGALKVLTVMGSFVAGAAAMAYAEIKKEEAAKPKKNPYTAYMNNDKNF